MRRARSDWTSVVRKGRRAEVVEIREMARPVTDVAFDQFVFDERGVVTADGAALVRGTSSDGTVIAVGSAPWPDMPFEWVALQSRSADLLRLEGDEMEPVGHDLFDDRFAVDADDVSLFRRLFRTSLREWLVDLDDAHGPLFVVFDGPGEPARDETPQRRSTDDTEASGERDAAVVPTVFVARAAGDDHAVHATLDLAIDLVRHVRATVST